MKKSWWYRFALLVCLIVISIYALIPTFFPSKNPSSLLSQAKITLGLDLQGGLYIVLGVDFNKVYRDEVKNYAAKVIATLKENDIVADLGNFDFSDMKDPKQKINIADTSKLQVAKNLLKEYYSYPLRLTGDENNSLELGLQSALKAEIEKSAIEKSTEVIRNRIDEFGVSEPEITSLGKDKVIVQLPGVKDIEKAKELIGKAAKLTFRFVNDEFSAAKLAEILKNAETQGIVYKKGENFSTYLLKLNQFAQAELPAGHEIMFEKKVNRVTHELESKIPYLVESNGPLSGEDLQDAGVRIDQQNQRPYVGLSFKPTGAKIFGQITEKNVGRRMAIILDGNVYSAPVIRDKITGGQAQITLGAMDYNSTLSEAKDLSLVLRAGALPVELEFQEQRIVGPSLGSDSIKQAAYASVLGCLAVFILMVFYYRTAGFIAVITLVLNVLFTLSCLVAVGATLTLPGIAGIALTVGMAVDGNIIIYERIRDELRLGATFKAAVLAGFDRAFWTIVDANLTTLVAGIALLNFGTGPIRGFAVTLIIGVLVTVYTAYFVSEVCFDWFLHKTQGRKASI